MMKKKSFLVGHLKQRNKIHYLFHFVIVKLILKRTTIGSVNSFIFSKLTGMKLFVLNLTALLMLIAINDSRAQSCAKFTYTISNDAVSFLNQSTCANQTQFYWDFGDGNSGITNNPTHFYSNTGTYFVQLKIKSFNVFIDSIQDSIVISNLASNCGLFYVNVSSSNRTASFYNTSICPNQKTNKWYYGDGMSSTNPNVTHVYPNYGTFISSLVVFDSLNNKLDSVSGPVNVYLPNGDCAKFLYHKSLDSVRFVNNSGCYNQQSFYWDFGDGSPIDSGQTVYHTYSLDGTYQVKMIVRDLNGVFIDSIVNSIVINYVDTCASFYYNQNNYKISFFNTSSCANATFFTWDFGDSNTGNGTSPSHTYSQPGTYDVTLSVRDQSNHILDTTHRKVFIAGIPGCNAEFTTSQSLYSNRDPIPGHLDIYHSAYGNKLTRLWDMGDGTTSNLEIFNHTYSGDGPYTVCFTVDNGTCSETFCDVIEVDNYGMMQKKSPGFTVHIGGYNPNIGTEEFTEADLNIYPNPFSSTISISFNRYVDQNTQISILNLQGQEVFSSKSSNLKANQIIDFNLDHLKNGVYILKLNTENISIQQKLIKK